MRKTFTKATGGAIASMLAGSVALWATAASAGVTGCSAPGGKQEAGAVIGALVGGFIGNQVGGRQAAGETIAGAAVGAAAGSAIGCEAQKDRGRKAGSYMHHGYRLDHAIAPASYRPIGDVFVAEAGVNLRAAPTARSAKVGRLSAGERFQAMASVRGTDWILVGQGGVGIGYVRGDFVRRAGHRYAAY